MKAVDGVLILVVTGLIALIACWLFLPPIIVVGSAHLISPRLGIEFPFFEYLMFASAAWLAANVLFVILSMRLDRYFSRLWTRIAKETYGS